MSSILIVDDNVHLIAALGKMLEPLGQLRFATSGSQALRQMREQAPDLVLLDAQMPGMSGFSVCEAMRADEDLAGIPVIFVTAHNDAQAEVAALAAGAVDFISKPVNEPILLARVKTQLRLKTMSDALRNHATLDGLTGIRNRRSFDERLRSEWTRAARNGRSLALLLVDVDHFKKFNDHYGHPAGDDCLKRVAGALSAQARRAGDFPARIGGEEFALLLPDTDLQGAKETAERVLISIRQPGVPHAASPTAAHVTASLGLSVAKPRPACGEPQMLELIQLADEALYRAKSQGRNQFATAFDGEPAGGSLERSAQMAGA